MNLERGKRSDGFGLKNVVVFRVNALQALVFEILDRRRSCVSLASQASCGPFGASVSMGWLGSFGLSGSSKRRRELSETFRSLVSCASFASS